MKNIPSCSIQKTPRESLYKNNNCSHIHNINFCVAQSRQMYQTPSGSYFLLGFNLLLLKLLTLNINSFKILYFMLQS